MIIPYYLSLAAPPPCFAYPSRKERFQTKGFYKDVFKPGKKKKKKKKKKGRA